VAKRVVGRVELRTEAGGVEAEALFDTGATKSFVSSRLADELGYVKYREPKKVMLAVEGMEGPVVGYLVARVVIDGCELPLEHAFGVVDGLRHDAVIGMDVMEPYDVELDVKEGRARLRRVPPTLEVA
jgi:predicted aspartyl protease